MEKVSRSIAALIAAGFVFLMLAGWIITPDMEWSAGERRLLTKAEDVDTETLFTGGFWPQLEKYLRDQLPQRDAFRGINAAWTINGLSMIENNGVYSLDDYLIRIEHSLKEKQVSAAVKKIRQVIDAHPEAAGFYWGIIPDKGCFGDEIVPGPDYERMSGILKEGLPEADPIDLSQCLSLSDYYRTDIHWRQEALVPVAVKLCEVLGAESPAEEDFDVKSAGTFSGVLAGEWALGHEPDVMNYMTSSRTDTARVSFLGAEDPGQVYDLSAMDGVEAYDLFLGGPQSLVVIDAAEAVTGRELIIFRDSFGSSLAPLLLESYDRICLVDTRYITTAMAEEMLDFQGADVLFLYSTALLNSGGILK